MRQNGVDSDVGVTRRTSIPSRIVLGGCVVVIMLVLSVVLSFWRRGVQQQARVAELMRRYGSASIHAQYGEYRYEPPKMNWIYENGERKLLLTLRYRGFEIDDDPPRYLEWVIPFFGEDCFARVTDICLTDEEFSDADVELLLAFPDLKVVDVSYSSITDKGLIKLASIEGLVQINVEGTNVTAESLRRLSQCRNLREIDIRETHADDEVVAYLREALPECTIER